jgi:hypothetical protein
MTTSNIEAFFEEDENSYPLSFVEVIGDHAITDSIRQAVIWASIDFFVRDSSRELIDEVDFSDNIKKLSKSIIFHGPYTDIEIAMEDSKLRVGVIVAPKNLWTKEDKFVYVAVLAN